MSFYLQTLSIITYPVGHEALSICRKLEAATIVCNKVKKNIILGEKGLLITFILCTNYLNYNMNYAMNEVRYYIKFKKTPI